MFCCFVENNATIRTFIFFSHFRCNSFHIISIPQKGAVNKEVSNVKKPYLKIRRLAEDQDLNQGALAVLIGVSPNTMTARLKGTQPWRSDEIVIICRTLHIPQEKIGEYFFPAITKEDKPA